MDLAKMTSAELKTLQGEVSEALEKRLHQDRVDAKAAAEKAAGEFGFSLSVLVEKQKAEKPKAASKYKNPNDPRQTWSGRGRKPGWLIEALAAGVNLESLEI